MNEALLKKRTKDFAKDIIRLCRVLPNNREGKLIGDQVFRSATSVAANYRAACRGRSKAEFVSKLAIVEEEADETLFWLELLVESGIVPEATMNDLHQEADELLRMTIAAIKTTKRKM